MSPYIGVIPFCVPKIYRDKRTAYLKERIQNASRQKGKLEQKRKNSFLQNGIKYLPVILERSGIAL